MGHSLHKHNTKADLLFCVDRDPADGFALPANCREAGEEHPVLDKSQETSDAPHGRVGHLDAGDNCRAVHRKMSS